MRAYARELSRKTGVEHPHWNWHAGNHESNDIRFTKVPDKTARSEARPGAKEKIRNWKRAMKKKARTHLKRDLNNQLEEIDE